MIRKIRFLHNVYFYPSLRQLHFQPVFGLCTDVLVSFSFSFPKYHLSLFCFIFGYSFQYMYLYVYMYMHVCIPFPVISYPRTFLTPFLPFAIECEQNNQKGVDDLEWNIQLPTGLTQGQVRYAVWYNGGSGGVFWCLIMDWQGTQTESWYIFYYAVLKATLYYRCYQFKIV